MQVAKKEGAASSVDDSSLLRRRKVCPKCCEIISVGHALCRSVHIAGRLDVSRAGRSDHGQEQPGVVPLLGAPQARQCARGPFGEHRILDKLTVKKLGEELLYVASRPDCQNLLLNFTGVVGLCTAMLGIMLMLRKKIGKKPGKL